MTKLIAAVRFEPIEKEWITTFAKMNDKSFSAQVCECALERLEDEMDAFDLKAALEQDDGARFTLDEVFDSELQTALHSISLKTDREA